VIYFAQTPTGSIKIGTSDNVDSRLLSLEQHYGQAVALLATMPGDRQTEREIHERFSHLRLGRTEQFRPAAELMEFIGKPLLVGANPDAVEAVPSVRRPTVRLDLSEKDHARLERRAEKLGLNLASCARMAVLAFLNSGEEGGGK
jgi:Meiotically up-regulated gene 113